MKSFKILLSFAVLVFILVLNCSKIDLYSGKEKVLKFSVDTLTIDTVFTTLGSATASVKIYNTSNQTIKISRIYFLNTLQKAYKINIDGTANTQFENVEIAPNDSIYLFVKVTVDPQSGLNEILLQESIAFEYNGVSQFLVLRALGIDAYFHYGDTIDKNMIWPNDKPHVVIEKINKDTIIPGIFIPAGITLTIPPGTKVFFNSQAGILCAGTLKIEGTKTDSVVLRGIRLTSIYHHNAGAWLGLLYLRGSKKNTIKYAYIDESILGIYMGFQTEFKPENMTDNTRAEIFIANSFVKNAYYYAIRSMNNKIKAENSVFFTSTDNLCQLSLGGDYEFNNCTFYNSQSPKKKEVLALTNYIYYEPTNTTYKGSLSKANFVNCIWNTTADEAILIEMKDGVDSNYLFTNCHYSSKKEKLSDRFKDCKLVSNPKFKSTSPDQENFHLLEGSPCINTGISNGLPSDIEDNPRNGIYDVGAYEFQ